jgi:hypothetical protein
MSAKHTPGPWFDGLPADGGRINVYAGDGMALRVCRVDSDADFGNHCAANARLIAVSPGLLAFVESWLADFTAAGTTDSPREAEARALIAKARGA